MYGLGQGPCMLAIDLPTSRALQPTHRFIQLPQLPGEVAEDLANYLVDSEQVNTALALGVSLSRDCAVRSAGGFMVQVK